MATYDNAIIKDGAGNVQYPRTNDNSVYVDEGSGIQKLKDWMAGIVARLLKVEEKGVINAVASAGYVGYPYPTGFTQNTSYLKMVKIVNGSTWYMTDTTIAFTEANVQVAVANTSLTGKPIVIYLGKL